MTSQRFRQVKHAQKESFFLREISGLFLRLCIDDSQLNGVYVTRVKLSPDRGRCTIFLQDHAGKAAFDKKMGHIIMYKPSLRSAIAQVLQARYTPDLTFAYDEAFEKQRLVDELIEQLKKDDVGNDEDDSGTSDDDDDDDHTNDEHS